MRIDNLRLYRSQFITNIPDGMAARFSVKKKEMQKKEERGY